VKKNVLTDWNGSNYATTNTIKFVYDGWNLISETLQNQQSTTTTHYIWGTDLSGSLQGAGGIGGLLCVVRNGTPYYPLADGNGNITDYVDADGAVVAHREFDPFGNTIVATGDKVNDFHFWFSSKYLDQETGLYYYGYRFYSPELGRWPSRDPIGTRGGLNIYGFVGNQPISRLDKLGLSWWNCCNECSPLGKKQLKGMKTYLAPGTKGDISPSVGEVGQDLLGSLETLGLIQSAGDLASAQKLAELLLSLADTAIDDGRSGSFQEAALSGIEAIRQNLLKLEGAVVWVRLDWDTCKERRCIIFIKYNDWVADHKWKRCQRGGTHVSGGFDLSVPGELGAGVSGCIRDAVGEFVNGSF